MAEFEHVLNAKSHTETVILLREIISKAESLPPEFEDDGVVLKALANDALRNIESAKQVKVKNPF